MRYGRVVAVLLAVVLLCGAISACARVTARGHSDIVAGGGRRP